MNKTMNKTIKHLLFYLGAISSVMILFTIATSYGEANLKSATKIEGIYMIETSIPNCGDNNLQLIVQQSGIYINAAIAPLGEKSKGLELSGKWQGQNLVLAGNSKVCNALTSINALVESKKIIGKITISNNTSDFTATQVDTPEQKEKPNSH
jgi:hypothetical protein